jgi:tetratricopeptide (TPR) repeat protein
MKARLPSRWLRLGLGFVFLAACASTAQRKAAENERSPQYQYEKAVVCMQYNMVDEAFKYLQAALALDPRHSLALNLQGLAQMIKGNLPAAVTSFQASIAVNPNFSEAQNNLGTALQESNRLDEAETAFKNAFALDENYNASYNLAKMAYTKGRYEEALGWIQKSLAKYNRSLLAFNLQGLTLEALERLDEAVASYQLALKLVPNEPNVQYNLGVAYFKKKDYDRAKEIMTRILEELVKNPKAGTEDLRTRVQDILKRIAER